MSKWASMRLYFLGLLILVTSLASCNNPETGRRVEGVIIHPGEFAVVEEKVIAPEAEIIRMGESYAEEADLPVGSAAAIIYNNKAYVVYNPGFKFFDSLNEEVTKLSVIMYVLDLAEHYQHSSTGLSSGGNPKIVRLTEYASQINWPSLPDIHFGKCSWFGQSYDYELNTGIGIDRTSSDNRFAFANCKKRWSAVESGNTVKFLPPPDYVDGLLGTFANIFDNVVNSRSTEIEVRDVAHTYGSFVRALYIPPVALTAALLPSWRESLLTAYNLNRELYTKLVAIDMLSYSSSLLSEIIGLVPLGSCLRATAATVVSNTAVGEAIDFITNENFHNAGVAITSGLTTYGDCVLESVCAAATEGACLAVTEILHALTFVGGTVEETVLGAFDSQHSLSYEAFAPVPFEYKITLTWGERPRDLDLHFWFPDNAHIWYANKTIPGRGFLDVDDVTSYGPENITIFQIGTGEHWIAVHNFSNETSILESGATVLIQNGRGQVIGSFNIPNSGPASARWWIVAKILEPDGEVVAVNRLSENPPIPYSATYLSNKTKPDSSDSSQ